MRTYEHHQTGVVGPIIGGPVIVGLLVFAMAFDGMLATNLFIGVVVIVVLAMFSRLRTHVDHKVVTVAFTFGWPRRTIPVEDIDDHSPVRNKWIYGYGVRLVPGGVMYNVAGLDAVAITYRHKGKTKTFRIGTDDPAGLDAAIADARAARPVTG